MERVEINTKLKELVYDGAYKKYEKLIPENIKIRIEKELKSIIDNKFAEIYLTVYKLVDMVKKDGYIVINRGSIGSSIVAYCLGITEIDPIKYNISFEIFASYDKDREPDIALCVPNNYKQQLEECVEDKYLDRITFRIYESNIPVILYRLKELTGVDPTSITLDDEKTLNMICSAETIGIPEFETELARNIILETKPTTFEDLVKIYGLLKDTDVWENNAQDLIKSGTATLSEVITTRDDIMNYLISEGIDDETAFKIMEFIRKGRPRKNNWQEEWEKFVEIMQEYNVPNWYIKSCEKISYLFPRAHIVGYVINNFRIAWYKAHYKTEFDNTILKYNNTTDIDEL